MVGDPAGKMIAQAVATAESSPLWRGRQRSRYNTSPCNFCNSFNLFDIREATNHNSLYRGGIGRGGGLGRGLGVTLGVAVAVGVAVGVGVLVGFEVGVGLSVGGEVGLGLANIGLRKGPLRLGSLRSKGDCCGRAGANGARRKALRRDCVTFSSDCNNRGREPRTIPKRLCPVQPDADEIRHRALRRRCRCNCRSWSWCRTWSRGWGCSWCGCRGRCCRRRWGGRRSRRRRRCPSGHRKGIDFVVRGEVNATASDDPSIPLACVSH